MSNEPEQCETPKASDLPDTFPSLTRLSEVELATLLYAFGQLNTEAKKYALVNVIDFAGRMLVSLAGLVVDAGYKNADELVASLAARSKRVPGVN